MVGAEGPLAVGEGALVQRDGPSGPARGLVGVGEVVPGVQGVGVVGAQDPLPVGPSSAASSASTSESPKSQVRTSSRVLEPHRALWQAGEKVTAAEWLLAVEDIQRFSRRVAHFFTGFDAFLTPTMSTPPLPIGAMVSSPEDPWRSLEVSGQTVRYAGVVANLTGNPAMSVPLWWNDVGLPIGVHFLGRFGDEATLIRLAAQLETAQPWAGRLPGVHAARPLEP